MAEFLQEKNVLKELEKVRDTIRRKHMLLKHGKADFNKAIGETFKPIINPLEELVAQGKEKKSIPNNTTFEFKKRLSSDDDDDIDDTLLETTIRKKEDTSFETAVSEDGEEESITNQYLTLLRKTNTKDLDKLYGVRKTSSNTYMIGNAMIGFENNFAVVDNVKFPESVGLLELLFKKNPNKDLITTKDQENYRKILEISNVHRKEFNKYGSLRAHKSGKFHNIIAPFFHVSPNKKGGKGLLSKYKIARIGSLTDYKYWDDPNELVDRLRLLEAETSAGNYNHVNEIHSILEELREGGYIY